MTKQPMYRSVVRILALVLLSLLLSTSVFADTGPHESVRITVELPEGQRAFYATLLSKYEYFGPYQRYETDFTPPEPYQIPKPLSETVALNHMSCYRDPDGYILLNQVFWCKDGGFRWGYMPPSEFKLLLWFPDTGELICSEAVSRFEFDSVFTARLEDGILRLVPDYDYLGKLLSFLARLALTLLIELGLALLMGYQWKPVLKINLITQILLNLLLALMASSMGSGGPLFYLLYLVLEFFVFFAEGVYYVTRLPEINPKRPKPRQAMGFAFLANLLSFGAGLLLISNWPQAF